MTRKGRCECGAVTYQIAGAISAPVACHCSQCRRTSGHYWAASQVANSDLKLTNATGLKWFRSSDTARRGFCTGCGASLFWEMDGEGKTSVAAGTLDGPTGLTTSPHIFVADKGDYYDLPQGVIARDRV